MVHYHQHIENFGAPNGLCSSIMESKHISVVKRPWCHSSCHNAINQIVETNQYAEKLSAACAAFTTHGMLNFPTWQPCASHLVALDNDDNQSGTTDEEVIYNEVFLAQTHSMQNVVHVSNVTLTTMVLAPNYPHSLHGLGHRIGHPSLPDLV